MYSRPPLLLSQRQSVFFLMRSLLQNTGDFNQRFDGNFIAIRAKQQQHKLLIFQSINTRPSFHLQIEKT